MTAANRNGGPGQPKGSPRKHGAVAVESSPPAGDERFLWALTAEHAALQSARSSTVFESNGRMTQYLSTVSGALIALGFVGQVSKLGDAFYAFAFTILPALSLLGLLTYLRCVESATEDLLYARAIGRIRQYYGLLDPDAGRYLALSGPGNVASVHHTVGGRSNRWHLLSHSATMILAVVAIVSGAFAGLLSAEAVGLPLAYSAGVGAVVAGGVATVLTRDEARRWRAAEADDAQA
jgi:hypothetical protein